MSTTGRPSQLKPGESNVDSATIVALGNGKLRMQWDIRLPNGRLVHRKVERKSKRKMDVRERARRVTDELLRSGGTTMAGGWKPSSDMGRYVDKVVIKAIRENGFARPLRPNTQERYENALKLFSEKTKGIAIADAVRPQFLRQTFYDMANEHGTSTTRKCVTVVSKYVMKRLYNDGVIDGNPLRDLDLELPERSKKNNRGGSKEVLTPDERLRCVEWLLTLNPKELVAERHGNGQGRWSEEQRARRWDEARDVTLIQATCGLRINEALSLERRDVGELLGHTALTVRKEVSKTKKPRQVPIMDERVAEALRRRLDKKVDPKAHALVFGSPGAPERPWDRSNAHKTMRTLYDRMGKALGIEKLADLSTHSWRKTLNTEWMEMGIPAELRAEYFGHDEEENQSTYTNTRDTKALLGMLEAGGFGSRNCMENCMENS